MNGDRGTTLVEVVVGLFLVAMAAGLLASLMTSTTRSTADDTVDPDVGLAVDALSRDVREADHVAAETRRGRVIAVTLISDTASVRWSFVRDTLVRDDGGAARSLAIGVDPLSSFTLRGADGAEITATDADAVRWCTRLVEIELIGEEWAANRSTALRVDSNSGLCP